MDKKYTIVGTDIEEVRRRNAQSGLSYRQVKDLLAQTGGRGTAVYSKTNAEEVRSRLKR
ncbi:gamma-type small acid-soluble spore protein [Ectobacillus ponti]|uniref:Gamma-type small acid-soluble spore protein n=1 Tax=Ectobacillus ponti TaxID=2961894 RepID=A0AA41X5Y8_9BACI|nr:gamma-type small acid-soluble spore protein [Ectobacillus ponti]MCP8967788.1 gamma-type small acid-soluble spore protein [Ectobacillus ponti]